jgi:hypothetical protein
MALVGRQDSTKPEIILRNMTRTQMGELGGK